MGTFEKLELLVNGEQICFRRGTGKQLVMQGSNFQATANSVHIVNKTIIFEGNVRLEVRKNKSHHAEISSDHAVIDLASGQVDIKMSYTPDAVIPTVAR